MKEKSTQPVTEKPAHVTLEVQNVKHIFTLKIKKENPDGKKG